jgi:enediyne biosynthesis thioesterase
LAFEAIMQQITSQSYRPRITFQDTNVVGNVYFLNFFRWQADCRDQWLRTARPELWAAIRRGEKQLYCTNWCTKFENPFGATIGDDVEVNASICESHDDLMCATGIGPTRIAKGTFSIALSQRHLPASQDFPVGPCYSYIRAGTGGMHHNSIDLLGLQGKCRELFLADFAANTLRMVATQELVLQTTEASLDLLQHPLILTDLYRIEMRLDSDPRQLKWGQMQVRFDYFAISENGTECRFAVGRQRMSSKHKSGESVVPFPFSTELLLALRKFSDSPEVLAKIDRLLCDVTASSMT